MTSVSNTNFLTPNISIVDTVQLIKEKTNTSDRYLGDKYFYYYRN